jgi:hypothetical protein
MMNQLTERNMAMWQEFQKNMAGSMGASTTPPKKADTTKR